MLVASILALLISSCSDPTPPVRVDTVTIAAPRTVLLLGPGGGESLQLTATPRDGRGEPIADRTVLWSTSGTGIVSVSATGVVTAVGLGTIGVRAQVDAVTTTISVTVVPVPVASLDLPDTAITLRRTPSLVERVQVVPTLRDSTGAVLGQRPVTWISRVPSVVSVDPEGFLTPLSAGSSAVVASLDGVRDSVIVNVTVQTQLPSGLDLRILDVRWTQGSQNAEGTIPMLTGGRAAVVNVMTSSPTQLAVADEYVLRLYTVDGELASSDTLRVPVIAGAGTDQAPTAQFLVPSHRLQPGMRWEVVRDPRGLIRDDNAENDRYPAGTHEPLNLYTQPVLRLRFVPIVLTSHGNATGNVNAANLNEYLRVVRQFGPIGEIEATIAPPFASSASFGVAPTGGGGAFWIAVIQQLDAARVASASDADAYWVAIVAPPAGFNFTSFGGMAFIPFDGTSSGPGTRTLSLVNAGWFGRESQSRELVMHELGHTLGRFHAPCGGAGGPDPDFPNAGGRVGDGGHDTWSFETGATPTALAVEPSLGDIMGYCSPTWISSHNYLRMLTFRGRATVALQAPPTRTRAILVQANVEGSTVRIEGARVITGAPSTSDPSGPWLIEGHAADGTLLFQHRTQLGRWDHLEDVRPLSALIALSVTAESTLHTITIRGPSGELTRRAYDAHAP